MRIIHRVVFTPWLRGYFEFIDFDGRLQHNNNMCLGHPDTANSSQGWQCEYNFLLAVIPDYYLGLLVLVASITLLATHLILRIFRVFAASHKSKIIGCSQHTNGSDSGIEILTN
jgi:hypothetical protein